MSHLCSHVDDWHDMYYDSCALELREKNERFRNLTDRIWDELADAYELDEIASMQETKSMQTSEKN